ncbi:NnrS family protein [Immundisolibacter cernigliae]|uniref:Short-chain dehydrogenase n=1 Tax=Immundisolibacter cernigliae TaxID=1810504 RepID=A0A1B1YVI6_9GAMM|nr:NnrS family protein [Immundisolibacter cernigliae]ANX04653.1 hypothetical protein PG2T_11085 [Immundisolibacter cernigliae]
MGDTAQASGSSSTPPLWRLGFRPFFLGAALFAVLAAGLWAEAYVGWLGGLAPRGGWLTWHMHEMPFGFAAAVIAGFLLTAVQTWTGSPGLRGRWLAAVFALWLAARIGWLWPGLPWPVLVALELAFLPAVAVRVGWQLGRVGQRRNYPLVALLVLLTLMDALALGALAMGNFEWLRRAVWAALWLIGTVIAIVGGRVIPLFTASGLQLPAPLAPRRWLEAPAHGGLPLLAGLALAGVGLAPDMRLAPLFLLLGIAHALRLARWFRPGVLRVPLLWSLHLAYAWLVAALLGLATWHLGLPILGSAALHLFTIGTIGGLILAMMARVSLGHTGRALQPPALMSLAFGAVAAAAAVRAGLAGVAPRLAVALSAMLWCLGFGLFVWCYAPMLSRPRVDGGAG